MHLVKTKKTGNVPPHLRDAHYKGAQDLGHVGYLYPHDYPNHYVNQQYLPDEIIGERFYEPSDNGYEKVVKDRLKMLKNEENE